MQKGINHLSDTVEFKCADVFDLLPALENEGKQFENTIECKFTVIISLISLFLFTTTFKSK